MTHRFETETRATESHKLADSSAVKADWSTRSSNSVLLASDSRPSSQDLVKQDVLPQMELVDNKDWKADWIRRNDKWGQPRLDDSSELQRQQARLSRPETPAGSEDNNSESRQRAREKARDTFEPPLKDLPDSKIYDVKKGDNLWNIARRELGPTGSNDQIQKFVKQVADSNQIKNPDLILPGQKIRLPIIKHPGK
ncbi:MAG: LysM peptidoglycan-binding domain-containing protein [Vicinamibacterales bacterium]